MQAEKALLLVKNEAYKRDYGYLAWLARCHIMNNKPEAAWKLYLHIESKLADESYRLLHVIADECYCMGHFYTGAKAFQVRAQHLTLFSRLDQHAHRAGHHRYRHPTLSAGA